MLPRLYPTKHSALLSALTVNDAAFWGADLFVGVVFSLFITQNINGGTAVDVGLAFGLYRAIRALSAIPIGRLLDSRRGHADEFFTVLVAATLVGSTYMALFFADDMWQVYLGMIFIGFGHSLDVCAWKVLFYENLPLRETGKIIGIYTAVMQTIYGASIVSAGFIGEAFGFEWVLLLGGLLTIMSGGALLLVRRSPM